MVPNSSPKPSGYTSPSDISSAAYQRRLAKRRKKLSASSMTTQDGSYSQINSPNYDRSKIGY